MARVTWRNAFLVGVVCAILEALLILVADPGTDRWVFIQSISFWLGCGMVVYMADSGIPPIPHGVTLTVLLNIPWYIALSIVPGNLTLLPPLVIASIIFGIVIGLLKKKLRGSHSE